MLTIPTLLLVDIAGYTAQADDARAGRQPQGLAAHHLLDITDEITRARLKRAIVSAVNSGETSTFMVGAGADIHRRVTVRPARESGRAAIEMVDAAAPTGASSRAGGDTRPQ